VAIGIDYLVLRLLSGPLLYFPFVLASFILYFRFGVKVAIIYLLCFAIFTAYFFVKPLSSFAFEEKSDLYILLGLWFLSSFSLLFIEWTRESFGDHH
jgi:integral membrane sensor domain MASE1